MSQGRVHKNEVANDQQNGANQCPQQEPPFENCGVIIHNDEIQTKVDVFQIRNLNPLLQAQGQGTCAKSLAAIKSKLRQALSSD
jgi:hypothetical protein